MELILRKVDCGVKLQDTVAEVWACVGWGGHVGMSVVIGRHVEEVAILCFVKIFRYRRIYSKDYCVLIIFQPDYRDMKGIRRI